MDELSTELFCTISLLVSSLLARLSKKNPLFDNYLIPVQNLLIGVLMALVEWKITKDFKLAVAVSGIMAGGVYDIFHYLNIILKKYLKKED